MHCVQLLEHFYLHRQHRHQQLLFLLVQQKMSLSQHFQFWNYLLDMGMDLMMQHQHQLEQIV
tara:strand:- start:687 stop:872 length:186 start_codon:yes stop_codon:yes gene_type:complete